MKSVVNPDKAKIKFSFKVGFIAFWALFLAVSAFGEDIKTINIVTPSWKAQTNRDGTGLYFDIVRSVYEPVNIKMEYNFVPWARAEKMIKGKKADAMLCASEKKDRLTPKYPMIVENISALFRKENIKWEGLKSLNGKSAVWLRGYAFPA
ncbi:MAG: hypothetical protein GY795_43015, partial [Desulfobacterales bacterium]|nr:hypothetical protein [Desulfobacterales bacterium]